MKTLAAILLGLITFSVYSQTNNPLSNTDSLFRQYPVKLFEGIKHDIDFNSNRTARRYKTRISDTYKGGLNFGGHYCFVKWGCGSPCKESAIVDLITGKVYDGPGASRAYDYRKESRVLIVNPIDTSNLYVGELYEMQVWIWNEKIEKFEMKMSYVP